jgi:hypothetical protein
LVPPELRGATTVTVHGHPAVAGSASVGVDAGWLVVRVCFRLGFDSPLGHYFLNLFSSLHIKNIYICLFTTNLQNKVVVQWTGWSGVDGGLLVRFLHVPFFSFLAIFAQPRGAD